MEKSKLIFSRKEQFFAFLISIFFMVSISTQVESLSNKINVLSYGVTLDDLVDDTKAIQEAIDYQNEIGGGEIFFPKGVYLVDAISSIVVKDNITLNFEKGAILKTIPNSAENYQVIRISNVKNVQVIGNVEIIGERDQHLGTTGEWGMGISIRGSNNVLIENVIINNMWGDGIYIGSTSIQNYSENIKVINPILNNNRRQGISVISVKNLEINSAKITNTNGTPPQCGIDIEPNNSMEFLENVKIINLSTNNNKSLGLKIYLGTIKNSSNPISIYIDSLNNVFDGFGVSEASGVSGEIKVGEHYYITDREINKNPIVEEVYEFSSFVTGNIQVNSLIVVKVNNVEIGSARSNSEGKFNIKIPVQKAKTLLSVTAVDLKGEPSNIVNKVVKGKAYPDVDFNHWAYKEIEYILERNIISGYPSGDFKPENKTSRAEAAKMLVLALKLEIINVSPKYKDVSSQHWAKDYIATATKAGLFGGYPDGSFRPNNILTRAEMSKILVIAYKFEGESSVNFSDVSNSWAKSYISKLVINDIATGFPDNTFKPNTPTTRAQFSTFLARSMDNKFR
ncbi:S-layer homology domain-containing protein [Planomicrobium okeanokoites]|uniref:S-layer homology domain-containing protein n=1 Tax=Planomicrobium okeanokoites TaxID=244 RepID=UPI000A05099F|nr:S-layer homology domain-containing protein [Planomicrobium okeanokoites]